mmetsp:Transcript_23938/g.58093  ORF Transcript_23938/g.58093 Transcript_23938/m.58093 type:complete len:488 (+) Transcript_23938:67-1530(+)
MRVAALLVFSATASKLVSDDPRSSAVLDALKEAAQQFDPSTFSHKPAATMAAEKKSVSELNHFVDAQLNSSSDATDSQDTAIDQIAKLDALVRAAPGAVPAASGSSPVTSASKVSTVAAQTQRVNVVAKPQPQTKQSVPNAAHVAVPHALAASKVAHVPQLVVPANVEPVAVTAMSPPLSARALADSSKHTVTVSQQESTAAGTTVAASANQAATTVAQHREETQPSLSSAQSHEVAATDDLEEVKTLQATLRKVEEAAKEKETKFKTLSAEISTEQAAVQSQETKVKAAREASKKARNLADVAAAVAKEKEKEAENALVTERVAEKDLEAANSTLAHAKEEYEANQRDADSLHAHVRNLRGNAEEAEKAIRARAEAAEAEARQLQDAITKLSDDPAVSEPTSSRAPTTPAPAATLAAAPVTLPASTPTAAAEKIAELERENAELRRQKEDIAHKLSADEDRMRFKDRQKKEMKERILRVSLASTHH